VLFLFIAIIVALLPLRAWAGIAYPLYFAGVLMLVMTRSAAS